MMAIQLLTRVRRRCLGQAGLRLQARTITVPTQGLRLKPSCSAQGGLSAPDAAEQHSKWQHLPPVAYLEGAPAPTALSWARRRLQGVPESVLQRLFRQRLVKLKSADSYGPIGRSASLARDAVLAVPGWLHKEQQQPRRQAGLGELVQLASALTAFLTSQSSCPAGSDGGEALAAQLRAGLLYQDTDLLVFNKPSGLHVQGGQHRQPSLDDVLRQHFSSQQDGPPRCAQPAMPIAVPAEGGSACAEQPCAGSCTVWTAPRQAAWLWHARRTRLPG